MGTRLRLAGMEDDARHHHTGTLPCCGLELRAHQGRLSQERSLLAAIVELKLMGDPARRSDQGHGAAAVGQEVVVGETLAHGGRSQGPTRMWRPPSSSRRQSPPCSCSKYSRPSTTIG